MNGLRRMRLKRNMSQALLAEATGLTQVYISNLETGYRENPTYEVLSKLSKVLECEISDLFDESEEIA